MLFFANSRYTSQMQKMSTQLKSWGVFLFLQYERLLDHGLRHILGKITPKKSMITPEVYLGGQYGPRGITQFRQVGITGIVNMRLEGIPHYLDTREFHTLHLPTKDRTAPTLSDLKKGIAFIQKEIHNGGKVYIHCQWGEGRGATMVLAYLISTGMTLPDALTLVSSIRTIYPRKSQCEVLEHLEKELHKE